MGQPQLGVAWRASGDLAPRIQRRSVERESVRGWRGRQQGRRHRREARATRAERAGGVSGRSSWRRKEKLTSGPHLSSKREGLGERAVHSVKECCAAWAD